MGDIHDGEDKSWVIAALDRYERSLTLYAFQILKDLERARDVVQDVFLRLCLQERTSVEPIIREWLFTVCRHRALDLLRKESRMASMSESPIQDPVAGVDPADKVERADHIENLLSEVQKLPPKEREVLKLKFQQSLSYREIGKTMDLSVSHVGVLIHSALKSLRRRMNSPRYEGTNI